MRKKSYFFLGGAAEIKILLFERIYILNGGRRGDYK